MKEIDATPNRASGEPGTVFTALKGLLATNWGV
jgi:hypothetical protein